MPLHLLLKDEYEPISSKFPQELSREALAADLPG